MSILDLNSIIQESFTEDDRETTAKQEYLSEDVKLGIDLQSIADGKFYTEAKSESKSKQKLSINLEEVSEVHEMKQNYNQELIERVASAFAIDRLVEEAIIENEIEMLNSIEEAQGVIKNVVRQGQIKEKLFCPPGFKSAGGKCVKMTPQEITTRRKAAKIAIRTRKSSYAKNRVAMAKSRAKSMKIREKKSALMSKTRMV